MRFIFVLLLCLTLLATVAACQYIPKEHAKHPETGELLYVDKSTGMATTATHNEAGDTNPPLMVTDPVRVEQLAHPVVEHVSGYIPPPFDALFGIVATLGVMGLTAVLKRRRRKELEAVGVATDLIMSIETNTEAKEALKRDAKHELLTKQFVEAVTHPTRLNNVIDTKTLNKARDVLYAASEVK